MNRTLIELGVIVVLTFLTPLIVFAYSTFVDDQGDMAGMFFYAFIFWMLIYGIAKLCL